MYRVRQRVCPSELGKCDSRTKLQSSAIFDWWDCHRLFSRWRVTLFPGSRFESVLGGYADSSWCFVGRDLLGFSGADVAKKENACGDFRIGAYWHLSACGAAKPGASSSFIDCDWIGCWVGDEVGFESLQVRSAKAIVVRCES